MVALLTIGQANAQNATSAPAASAPAAPPVAVDDSLAAVIGTSYLDNNIRGYGKAEILGADGKKHYAYVLIEPHGFSGYLPFHRHEEDLRRFGREPFSIDVDKVQSLTLNGLYQEHMVVKGKRKHILATRLVKGPVELFNYTQITQTGMIAPVGGVAGAVVMGGMGLGSFPERQWFLRRAGEGLIKVGRVDFVAQMTTYFHDAPELLTALRAGKLRYRDMVQVVQAYNEYRTRPAPSPADAR